MNVHKRCQKNVANNCGTNTKAMAALLNEMGISPDKNPRPKTFKVTSSPQLPSPPTHCVTRLSHPQYLNPALLEGSSELSSSGDSESKDAGDKQDDKGLRTGTILL